MKRILILTCLCVSMVFVVGGCSKKDAEQGLDKVDITDEAIENVSESTDETNEVEGVTETTAPVDTIKSDENSYKEILDKYYVAMSEKWDAESVTASSINYMCVYAGEGDYLADTGYYITDIDGNGISELIIGFTSDNPDVKNMVFEVYTLVDGSPESILTGWERNRYYLRSDNKFANESSSGAAYSDWYVLQIAQDGMTIDVVEGLRTDLPDADDYSVMKWYTTTDMDYDWTNDTEVSEDEARQIIQQYLDMYVSIPFIPFSEYQYSK